MRAAGPRDGGFSVVGAFLSDKPFDVIGAFRTVFLAKRADKLKLAGRASKTWLFVSIRNLRLPDVRLQSHEGGSDKGCPNKVSSGVGGVNESEFYCKANRILAPDYSGSSFAL